jgi:hypothetical protein
VVVAKALGEVGEHKDAESDEDADEDGEAACRAAEVNAAGDVVMDGVNVRCRAESGNEEEAGGWPGGVAALAGSDECGGPSDKHGRAEEKGSVELEVNVGGLEEIMRAGAVIERRDCAGKEVLPAEPEKEEGDGPENGE